MKLRFYQKIGLEKIIFLIKVGAKKILLKMPTGSGKTVVFSEILKGAYAKGTPAIMVVRGRKLVDQAHKRLYRENVPHGVRMAGHWNFRPREKIQICSIDTLIARDGKEPWPDAKIVIIDEGHMATSPGYVRLSEVYPDAIFIVVTATPYVTKSIRHVAEEVVCPITMKELIEQGFLVPADYYVPGEPDLMGVRTVNGDYVNAELENVMDKSGLIGDAVTQWKKLADNRPSLYFCVSVQHSKHVAECFKAAGVPALHCDADTPEIEREAAIRKLESGEIRVITNVGIFCTGVDIPIVSCVGMLRPTKSYNLYIQTAGRGTRLHPESGKKKFLIIDHAGNVRKHGFITEDPEFSLDGRIKKFEPSQNPKVCEGCLRGYVEPVCPYCDFRKPAKDGKREIIQVDGELVRLSEKEISEEEKYFKELSRTRERYGYKMGWIYQRMRERFGEEIAQKFCPWEQKTKSFWRGR